MASKVVQEATILTVTDEQTQVINHEAKRMADKIEAKMEKEMDKARRRTWTGVWSCSFILVGAAGVIIESVELLKIPKSLDSPLALNHRVLRLVLAFSCTVMFFSVCNLAIHVKKNSNTKRKSLKTKLLLNLMRKANQAEVGLLRSAVKELDQEYGKKQKKLKSTREALVIGTTILLTLIGTFAATLGVAERFFHPIDHYFFWKRLWCVIFVVYFSTVMMLWCVGELKAKGKHDMVNFKVVIE